MVNNKCKKANYTYSLLLYIIILVSPACTHNKYIAVVSNHKQYSLKADSLHEASAMDTFIRSYKDSLVSIMQQQIGYSETPLTFAQPESNLGNLLADAVWHTSKDRQSIDMVVLSTQILGSHYHAPGKITLGNCYELLPKENALIIVSLTGKQLQQLSDSIAVMKGLPVAGCRILIHTNKSTSILIDQQSPKAQLLYTICFNEDLSKLRPFRFLQNNPYTSRSNISLRAALIAYLKEMQQTQKPLNLRLEQRISYE